ncbi:hypothetical protein [Alteromonas sp. C1M14]|uniref:hypothetical protein n=1 Tax=Alteromonas sp. C1M14 TaxID=2841567 RepID=UPI001C0836D3|nr:hypothetical protein [Alteromonas sp. C1M14]MBU2976985.1 hypothetical protein [Alteromonas sp. C1M14]
MNYNHLFRTREYCTWNLENSHLHRTNNEFLPINKLKWVDIVVIQYADATVDVPNP